MNLQPGGHSKDGYRRQRKSGKRSVVAEPPQDYYLLARRRLLEDNAPSKVVPGLLVIDD